MRYDIILTCSVVVGLFVSGAVCSVLSADQDAAKPHLVEHCQRMLEEQRAYDKTHHAHTVARVLQQMTNEMKSHPIQDVLLLLKHPEWEVRYSAARALIGNREARTDTVRSALADAVSVDTNQYSLPEIIQAAYYTHAKEATPALSRLMVSNQHAHVRRAAVEAQYWIRDPRSVPSLLRATHDSDSQVALRAIYVLATIGDRSALPRIRNIAFHGKADMQVQAVQALGIMCDRYSAEQLLGFLKVDDERLLQYSIWSLGQMLYAEAVQNLIPFMNHVNKDVQDAAYGSLLTIANLDVLKYFIGRYRRHLDDQRTFEALVVVYHKQVENLPDKRSDLTRGDLSKLAHFLSASLPRDSRKIHVEKIESRHIQSVREFCGAEFVLAMFERTHVEFIVLRDENGNLASAKIIGVAIQ